MGILGFALTQEGRTPENTDQSDRRSRPSGHVALLAMFSTTNNGAILFKYSFLIILYGQALILVQTLEWDILDSLKTQWKIGETNLM